MKGSIYITLIMQTYIYPCPQEFEISHNKKQIDQHNKRINGMED